MVHIIFDLSKFFAPQKGATQSIKCDIFEINLRQRIAIPRNVKVNTENRVLLVKDMLKMQTIRAFTLSVDYSKFSV